MYDSLWTYGTDRVDLEWVFIMSFIYEKTNASIN